MKNKEFAQRLVQELNDLKKIYNPISPPFFLSYSHVYNKIEIELLFGIDVVIGSLFKYNEYNEELEEFIYSDFIKMLIKFMLFYKESQDKKSIQQLITEIKI